LTMRRLSDFFIDNYPFALMMALALLLLGAAAYKLLPIEASPDVQIPIAIVSAVYPGAPPEDVERDVTSKLEEFVSQLDEIDYYASTSDEGYCLIWVVFQAGSDLEQSVRDVREKISQARAELPDDVEDPIVDDFSTADVPTVILSLSSAASESETHEVAREIEDRIELVSGVNRVDVFGGRKREIRVNVDQDKLNHYRIPLQQLVSRLKAGSADIPAGSLDLGDTKYTIRTRNRFGSLDEMERMVAAEVGGKPIYLRDVAEIVDGFEERNTFARLNGKPSINFLVYKKDNANTIDTSVAVQNELESFKKELPPGFSFVVTGDQAETSRKQISLMLTSAIYGAVLVVLVIFVFLGFRNSILISLAIPLSLSFPFVWLLYKGYSFNNVTMFGLVLVVGVLVDDAIIVVENIYRWLEKGVPRAIAAKSAAHEVGTAILFSGATTIAAFAPMTVMTGVTGQFMKFIPITVIAAIVGAMFSAHTVIPALAARHLVKSKIASKSTKAAGFVSRAKKKYLSSLNYLLRKPLAIPGAVLALWIVSIGLIVSGALDFEFFPDAKLPDFTFSITAPVGTSLDAMDRLAKQAEERIEAFSDDLVFTTTNVGSSGFTTHSFQRSSSGSNIASIQGKLKTENVDRITALTDKMRDALKGIPGAEFEFEALTTGPPKDAPVVIRITGDDLELMPELIEQVKSKLAAIPGLVDIRDNFDETRPELSVVIDRAKASLSGLDPASAALALRMAFTGIDAGEYFDERLNEQVDIVVTYPESARQTPSQLARISLLGAMGTSVPLNQIATVDFTSGRQAIQRRNGVRIAEVRAGVSGISPFAGLAKAKAAMREIKLPRGFSIQYSGENEDRDKSFGSLGIAMLIAIIVIFALLVLNFRSFLQPLVVMGTIPFSMIGVVFGLLITGNSFGIMSFVGIIALSGIVVNDAIVLVDYINQLRAKGMRKALAVRQACLDRMRPVFLTSITTIFGILPLASGIAVGWKTGYSELWTPLGWTMIFGLAMSTFLVLLVIPSIYMVLTWIEEDWAPRIFGGSGE